MKKIVSAFLLVTFLIFAYAFVPKTTVIHLSAGETESYTLTYTGLGIRGAGLFGFKPCRIVSSGPSGYDPGITTLTFTPTSSGWAMCEQSERGQVRSYAFAADSTSIARGILVPDLKHHVNTSYFYSPDGSTTGNIREGSGGYDIITPKFIHHYRVTDGVGVWSKSPSA